MEWALVMWGFAGAAPIPTAIPMQSQQECTQIKESSSIVRADVAAGNRMLVIQCLPADRLPESVRKQNPMFKQIESPAK